MALYDHLQDAKWLWVQSLGKKMPRAVFEVLAEGMNLVEDAVNFVRTKLNIVDATGVYLDQLAAKWGPSRMGLDDDSFRQVIIAEASSLFGSGDDALVLRLIRQLIGPGPSLKRIELLYHTFIVYIGFNEDIPDTTATILGQVLDDVPALTINGQLILVDTECLNYSDAGGDVDGDLEVTGWYGDADGPIDGAAGFAHVIQL